MVRIAPFEGIRYRPENLSGLVCPPYDIVSPARKKELLRRSKDNFIALELPVPFPAPGSRVAAKRMPGASPAPYAAAAKTFRRLISRGRMSRDGESYYLYTQRFKVGGKRYARTGIIAAVRMEDPARGGIYPHEKILPKPLRDRELLMSALRASTSPVFFLSDSRRFPDVVKKIKKYSRLVSRASLDGVSHELRAVSVSRRPRLRRFIEGFFASKPLFIADGHHRYSVARRHYLSRRIPAARYVPGFICGAFDNGTIVLSTHRILTPPPGLSGKLKHFRIISADRFRRLAAIAVSGGIPQPLKIRLGGKTLFLELKSANLTRKKSARGFSRSARNLRNLAASVASATILAGVSPEQIRYTSSESEAVSAADKENKLAVLLPPPPVKSILEVARGRLYMPQKTTYFYPKAYAGFVVYPFDKK